MGGRNGTYFPVFLQNLNEIQMRFTKHLEQERRQVQERAARIWGPHHSQHLRGT